jgi:hypothetical protein
MDDTKTRRDSDGLRASVLDAALLLGIGTSQEVRDWIFNNPIEEEKEEEEEEEEVSRHFYDR